MPALVGFSLWLVSLRNADEEIRTGLALLLELYEIFSPRGAICNKTNADGK